MADFNGQETEKKGLDESMARVILYCRNTLGSIINNVKLKDSKLFLKLRSLEDGFKYAESTFNTLKELKYKQSIGSENEIPFKEVHSIANKRDLKKWDFEDKCSIICADSNYFMIPKEIISTLFKNTIWMDPKIKNLHPSSIEYNINKNGEVKQIGSHESKLEIEGNSHNSRSNIDDKFSKDKWATFKINAKLDKSVFKNDNLNKHNRLLSDKKLTSWKSNSSEDEHDWTCFYWEISIDEENFVRTTCDCKLHIKWFRKKMKEILRGLRWRVRIKYFSVYQNCISNL